MKNITNYELKHNTRYSDLETLFEYENEDCCIELYRSSNGEYILCREGTDIFPKDTYSNIGCETLVLTKEEVPAELQQYI